MSEVRKPHVVFFGHHKCGSRFFRKQLLEPLAGLNGYAITSYQIHDGPIAHYGLDDLDFRYVDYGALSSPRPPRLLLLSNASQRVVGSIYRRTQSIVGIHVVRDPRQVWVSNYFHHKKGHAIESPAGWVWERLKTVRPILENSSLEDGLAHELQSITNDLLTNQLAAWKQRTNVLELKLESFSDVYRSDHPKLTALREFVGFDVDSPPRELSHHANPDSRPWQEVLTPRLKAMFKQRFGILLIDLGYESNFDW